MSECGISPYKISYNLNMVWNNLNCSTLKERDYNMPKARGRLHLGGLFCTHKLRYSFKKLGVLKKWLNIIWLTFLFDLLIGSYPTRLGVLIYSLSRLDCHINLIYSHTGMIICLSLYKSVCLSIYLWPFLITLSFTSTWELVT